MKSNTENLSYTETHEWVRIEGDLAVIGITEFAQNQLSDLTFVELPEVDEEFDANDEVAVLESVKAASDIYTPLSGRIVEINEDLTDAPELVNQSPFDDGWLFKIKISNEAEVNDLMTAKQYEHTLSGE